MSPVVGRSAPTGEPPRGAAAAQAWRDTPGAPAPASAPERPRRQRPAMAGGGDGSRRKNAASGSREEEKWC
jgi:hypothetical protein